MQPRHPARLPPGDPHGRAMTAEEERWSEAILAVRIHGAAAPVWIAERIGTLALAGDAAGVARFTDMAARVDALRSGTRQ